MFTPAAKIVHLEGQTTKKIANKFTHQFYGSVLINTRKHYGYPTFLFCRLLTALYFLLRVPYWAVVGVLRKSERGRALGTASVYLTGCYYALTDWTKLLINREEVRKKFDL